MHARILLTLTLSLTLLCAPARAQSTMSPSTEDRALFDVRFEGGTFADFLDVLRDGADGKMMFVTPEGADRVPMPAFELTSVTFPDVLALARQVGGFDFSLVQAELPHDAFEMEGGRPIVVFSRPLAMIPSPGPLRLERVDFPGGTLREYITALEEAGARGKIVVPQHADFFEIEPITLRDVTLSSAMDIVNGLGQRRGDAQGEAGVHENDGLFIVMTAVSRADRASELSRVWTLRAVIGEAMTADEMLGAIEAGLETLGTEEEPRLRYHEPTDVLIGVGDERALNLVDEIIRSLERTARAGAPAMSAGERMQRYCGALAREIERIEAYRQSLLDRAIEGVVEAQEIGVAMGDLSTEDPFERAQRDQMINERQGLIRTIGRYRLEAEAYDFRADALRTKLGQLERMIAAHERGEVPAPTEAELQAEFGQNAGVPSATPPAPSAAPSREEALRQQRAAEEERRREIEERRRALESR